MLNARGMLLTSAIGLALTLSIPKLGLAMGVKDGGGETEFLTAMRQQIRLGLDASAPNIKWDEYEAQSGKPLIDGLNAAKYMDQDVLLTISTIDTVKRRLPVEFSETGWTDPALISRFDQFLNSVADHLTPGVRWISLGNEVNAYLGQHPTEVDSYIAFINHGRETLRHRNPKLLVGVTVTFTDALHDPELAKRLQESMDISVFTYYPMDGFKPLAPSQVPSHFDYMMTVAGAKPLLLQEIGYPTSSAVGSSPDQQAKFIHQVFGQLDKYQDRIAMADYFMQTDFSAALMKFFEPYYGISDATFLSFLGSLGLCDSAGKPQAGWNAFRDEVIKRRPIQ